MHELAVTESILNLAERYGQAAKAARVTELYLVVGQLSSIVDDSVQFYWDLISAGTLCAGAKLYFERIPAELLCLDCKTTYSIPHELTPCPHCQSTRVRVTAGNEFYLDRIAIN